MTTGIYAAIGWRFMRVAGSPLAHLVPSRIVAGSRTACGRLSVYDTTVELPAGLLGDVERCAGCERRDGTAGPMHDGRVAQVGE